MELAISSIAWSNEEEPAVAETLRELGVKNVELAPTKIWDDPTSVGIDEAQKIVDWWDGYGIRVVAFQSMLFARPDLKIFENASTREACSEYLEKFILLAGMMGVQKMVFGSPKNRQRGELPVEDANTIAKDFFSELGETAKDNNVVLCLEPNAAQYACDFITTAKEGDSLVREVDNAGFGLHLDTACMALAGDDLGISIGSSIDILKHFHVSSPMLDQVEDRDDVDHRAAAAALKINEYGGYVSIEMRPGEQGTNVNRVIKAVNFTNKIYF